MRAIDLTNAQLKACRLAQANLMGATLRGASVNNTVCNGADLSQSDLRYSSFRDVDMTGARLDSAKLYCAALVPVTLTKASLHNADLCSARLAQCRLDQTIVKRAQFGRTEPSDIDLSRIIGLEVVSHFGPSTVGMDCLYRSAGNVPRDFLARCGVPSSFLDYVPALFGGPALTFHSTFISYSSDDVGFADRLFNDLFHRHGVRVWQDVHRLDPGDSLDRGIDAGIAGTDRVLLVCSKSSPRPQEGLVGRP
jgi:hypothetical protein